MEPLLPPALPQPSVCWYMCKYCWRSYTDMEKLFQHKFDDHRQEFLGFENIRPKKKRKPYTRRKQRPLPEKEATSTGDSQNPTYSPQHSSTTPTSVKSSTSPLGEEIPNEILAVIESEPLVPIDIPSVNPITMFLFLEEGKEPQTTRPNKLSTVPPPRKSKQPPPESSGQYYCKLCSRSFAARVGFHSHQRYKHGVQNTASTITETFNPTRLLPPGSTSPDNPEGAAPSEPRATCVQSPPDPNLVTCAFCRRSFQEEEYGNHRKICSKRLRRSFTRSSSLFRTIPSPTASAWRTDIDILKKLARGGNYSIPPRLTPPP